MRHLTDGTWKFVGYQGLASHGGVLGLLAGLWLYVRHLKVPGWVVLDNMGICAPLTSMFIRLGNLMNSEIIGRPTDVPWAFVFERIDQAPRHPGQLYEALAYFRKVAVKEEMYKMQDEACHLMGIMFYNGTGCEQNIDSAIYWLKRGADQFESAECAMFLASLYESEEHKDMPQAVKYYRKANEYGDTTALVNLGRLYANNGNNDRAAECFQEMIDKGQADGYFWMAMLYDAAGDSKTCNEYLSELAVLFDINFNLTLCLDLLDNLTALADNLADFVSRDCCCEHLGSER